MFVYNDGEDAAHCSVTELVHTEDIHVTGETRCNVIAATTGWSHRRKE